MSRRLPPLSAVRAFEAAARHGGFQRAGEELHVTAGAVAHQVKQLEAWLGLELFRRLARGVVLSTAGQRYADALQPLFNGLEEISDAARRQSDERVVTVTSVPSLVTNWLMPRLGRLREQHPDIDMRILSSIHTVDFQHEGVDVAIRLGTGPYPGMKAELLMEEWFSAVCSPAFRAAAPDIVQPADLLRHPLLHDEMEPRIPDELNWARWLQAFGVHYAGTGGASFSHTYLTLEAAAAGQGVAIAAEPFISGYLRAGRLVRLFAQRVQGPYCFYLLRAPAAQARPPVQAFCDWVKAQVQADQQAQPA